MLPRTALVCFLCCRQGMGTVPQTAVPTAALLGLQLGVMASMLKILPGLQTTSKKEKNTLTIYYA